MAFEKVYADVGDHDPQRLLGRVEEAHGDRRQGADDRSDRRNELEQSGKQSERVDDDGFSGAGFAGQKIEAFFKVKLKLIDQCKISNAKKAQHTRAL